jgi:hypothetical protein
VVLEIAKKEGMAEGHYPDPVEVHIMEAAEQRAVSFDGRETIVGNTCMGRKERGHASGPLKVSSQHIAMAPTNYAAGYLPQGSKSGHMPARTHSEQTQTLVICCM